MQLHRTLTSVRGDIVLLLLVLSFVRLASAANGGAAPANMAAGTPAGSYHLSGFENVNLFNGNLNFSLPLLQIGGRGGVQFPINLTINSMRWKLDREVFGDEIHHAGNYVLITS